MEQLKATLVKDEGRRRYYKLSPPINFNIWGFPIEPNQDLIVVSDAPTVPETLVFEACLRDGSYDILNTLRIAGQYWAVADDIDLINELATQNNLAKASRLY